MIAANENSPHTMSLILNRLSNHYEIRDVVEKHVLNLFINKNI